LEATTLKGKPGGGEGRRSARTRGWTQERHLERRCIGGVDAEVNGERRKGIQNQLLPRPATGKGSKNRETTIISGKAYQLNPQLKEDQQKAKTE